MLSSSKSVIYAKKVVMPVIRDLQFPVISSRISPFFLQKYLQSFILSKNKPPRQRYPRLAASTWTGDHHPCEGESEWTPKQPHWKHRPHCCTVPSPQALPVCAVDTTPSPPHPSFAMWDGWCSETVVFLPLANSKLHPSWCPRKQDHPCSNH